MSVMHVSQKEQKMRRWMTAAVLLGFIFTVQGRARQAGFPQKWIMAYGKGIVEREDAEDFIEFLRQAKDLGYTHVFFDEVYNQTLRAMPPKYFEHIAMVRDAAREIGITIVPGIFNVGYSWRVIWYDDNLAAGIPARDVPFVVRGKTASPDPSAVPVVENGGFEADEAGALAGWQVDEGVQDCVSADFEAPHGGMSSLKMSNFEALPRDEHGRVGSCSVTQTLAVEPFKYYRLTIWRRTSGLEASGSSVNIAPSDGKRRRLCYTNFEINPEADWENFVTPDSEWKQFQLTFNTLESTSIDVSVGVWRARRGAIWWDDLKIEPAGLANLLRGKTKPFVVKSADGSTVYEEGRDYMYAADVLMGKSPMPAWLSYLPPGGSFDVWHPGPDIRLTPKSRISDGETILVSYFHPHIIYGHQVVGSLTDPKVFKVFEEQMKYMVKYWNAPAYFMGYDEIRVAAWEEQPGGTNYKAGELLAQHISKAVAIAKKYAPDAQLYVWSDMFDPFHNARKHEDSHGYYLCNGDFYGSWEGLPSEVGIIKWGGGGRDCLKFFADRGHRIIISTGGPRGVYGWRRAAEGIDNVEGFMYANWHKDYSGLADFMKAIEGPLPPEEETPAGRRRP